MNVKQSQKAIHNVVATLYGGVEPGRLHLHCLATRSWTE